MKYSIIESNKCTFIDDDRQRLVDTLAFIPEKTEADIIELTDDAVVQGYDGSWYLAGYEPAVPADVALQNAKDDRAEAVSRIVVEVDGIPFDGDEKAQERMSRAVSTARARADRLYNKAVAEWLADQPEGTFVDASQSGIVKDDYMTYETTWVLADSTYTTVTISQLSEACELAGQTQTELWIKPYEEK